MKIIVLTYLNRSGSTFLSYQLSKSGEICICPEAEILYALFLRRPSDFWYKNKKKRNKAITYLIHDKKFCLWRLPKSTLEICFNGAQNNFMVFKRIVESYILHKNKKFRYALYKNSDIIQSYDQLSKYQEILKWIILIRDPRAVIYSQMKTVSPLNHKPMSTNIYKSCYHWNNFTFLAQDIKRDKYMVLIRYEDLIQDFRKTITNLFLIFKLKIDLDSSENSFPEWIPANYRPIHPWVNQNPDISRIDRWEKILSLKNQNLIKHLCREEMQNFQYLPKSIKTNLNQFQLIFTKINYIFWLKDLLWFQIKRLIKPW